MNSLVEHVETENVKNTPLIKWPWLRAILFFISGFLIMLVYKPVRNMLLHDNGLMNGFDYIFYARLLKFIFFFALLYLFKTFIDKNGLKSLGFNLDRQKLKEMSIGLAFGILGPLFIFISLILLGSIEIVSYQFSVYELILISGVMLVVAFFEELIYRLYFLQNLMKSMNKYISLLIVSVFFTLIHADNFAANPLGLINIFIAGFFMGLYYIYQKNVWFPIAFHFSWNVMLAPILGSAVSGNQLPSIVKLKLIDEGILNGAKFGFEGSFITTCVFILITYFIYQTFNTDKGQS